MRNMGAKLTGFGGIGVAESGILAVGRIVRVSEEGRAFVDWPGNLLGALEARSIVEPAGRCDSAVPEETPVLLVFENGDPSLPIVIGVIRDTVGPSASGQAATFSVERPKDAALDGRTVLLDAREEILLRCGKSSILLRKDGKIIVKGTEIVSRASGTNKIRGAAVKIN
jgi:hypothetical protein